MDIGTRRLDVSFENNRARVTERWVSRDMKSDFNDFVALDGYLYGFDGTLFGCIDLENGKRQWKKGRYGKGQVLLLSDAKELLVLSETGDLVLVKADPKKFVELARLKVLDGKTWNHPVVVENRLYARNGEEAVCYELPTVSPEATDPVAVQ
jgi:outer membrane protein assembly factor BamB